MSVVPLLVDLIAAFAAGLLALLGARWYARSPLTPERPTEEVARTVGDEVRQHTGLRRLVVRRLDRSVTTGLLLTLALALTLVGGLVLGVLALLVRRVAVIQHVDNSVAAWVHDHRSAVVDEWAESDHRTRQHQSRDRSRDRARDRRRVPPPQPVVVSLPGHGPGRNGGEHARREGHRRASPPDAQPGRRDARALRFRADTRRPRQPSTRLRR